MKIHVKLKHKYDDREELTYRRSMPVKEFLIYSDDNAYPICPKCGSSMDREYQSFCDRCGQKLDWDNFENAHANYIYPVKL